MESFFKSRVIYPEFYYPNEKGIKNINNPDFDPEGAIEIGMKILEHFGENRLKFEEEFKFICI